MGDQVPKKQKDEENNKHHVGVGGLLISKKTRVQNKITKKTRG